MVEAEEQKENEVTTPEPATDAPNWMLVLVCVVVSLTALWEAVGAGRHHVWLDLAGYVAITLSGALFALQTALGVRRIDGAALPASAASASIIAPAGHRGPAFLVFDNFRTILDYNRSVSYALAVVHLADRISGGAPFVAAWPRGEPQLSRTDKLELHSSAARLSLRIPKRITSLAFTNEATPIELARTPKNTGKSRPRPYCSWKICCAVDR